MPESLQPCGFPPRRQASADCNGARLRLCKLASCPRTAGSSADAGRDLAADARPRARRRIGDVRPRAGARSAPCRRARVPRLRSDGRAGRGRRPPLHADRRVPREHDDPRPDPCDVARGRAAAPPLARAPARLARRDPLPAQRDAAASRPSRGGDDGPRPAARAPPAVLLASRARVPARGLRLDRAAQPDRDRGQRARAQHVDRAPRGAG